MSTTIDYHSWFEQALQIVRGIRDPHATRADNADLGWDVVEKHELFDFGKREYLKYQECANTAKLISQSCIKRIIFRLLKEYGYSYREVEFEKIGLLSTALFILKEEKTNCLLVFKEIEKCNYWKDKEHEPSEVTKILDREGVVSCRYIYFMSDYAYLQIIGHNTEKSDPGRGYNAFSLRWFIETYFGKEESSQLFDEIAHYSAKVNEYLGFIFVKSLSPQTLLNFKKNVEAEILEYNYGSLLEKKLLKFHKIYELPREDFQAIYNRFIDEKVYRLLLGSHDFSESLITAEWLLDSMKKAQAIDLTVIAMGYFKAVEQLLFDLVCLQENDGHLPKKDLDSTIGAMAHFYKNNPNVLRSELHPWARTYIKETLFDYKGLRNRYLHKDNIRDWQTVTTIRDTTFELIFLLLGAHTLSNTDLDKLGMPDCSVYSDYYQLCEYVNYHSGELFYLGNTDEKCVILEACSDSHSELLDNNYVQYSGVYFKKPLQKGHIFRIEEKELPKRIYLGKLVFDQNTKSVSASPTKVKLIFENGKFVGPLIASEKRIEY